MFWISKKRKKKLPSWTWAVLPNHVKSSSLSYVAYLFASVALPYARAQQVVSKHAIDGFVIGYIESRNHVKRLKMQRGKSSSKSSVASGRERREVISRFLSWVGLIEGKWLEGEKRALPCCLLQTKNIGWVSSQSSAETILIRKIQSSVDAPRWRRTKSKEGHDAGCLVCKGHSWPLDPCFVQTSWRRKTRHRGRLVVRHRRRRRNRRIHFVVACQICRGKGFVVSKPSRRR